MTLRDSVAKNTDLNVTQRSIDEIVQQVYLKESPLCQFKVVKMTRQIVD